MPASTVLRAPQVPLVLLGSQVGRLPNAAAPLALLLFARQSVSLAVAGIVVAVFTAGMAVTAPLLARAVDRWRQPPVLYGSATLSAVGYLICAASGGHLAPLLAGAALAGMGTPPLEACLRALWPNLVPPSEVTAAYALDIALQEMIFVVGPLVTLAAVAAGGPATGLITAGVLQLAGVAAFVAAPTVRTWRGERDVHRHWAGPLRARRLVTLIAGIACVGAAVGSIPVVLTGYTEAAGDRGLTGWLLACQALGALVSGLLYTRARPGTLRRLPVLAVCFTAGYLPLLLVPSPGPMFALQVVSGFGLPPLLTAAFLAADRLAPPGTAVEAFAWIFTAFTVGSATGAALAGPLTDASIRLGFAFAPVAGLLAIAALAVTASSGRAVTVSGRSS